MTGRAHALDLVPGLAELAKAQQGVVRRDQLAGLGVTPGHVRSQVSGERWRTIGPFVVVLRNGRLTRAQQLAVGVLHAGDGALLAGRSSLETEGLRGWEVEQVHVLVARERRVRALAGVVVHRSTGLDESDATRTAWPPRTTSARATVDAASLERSPRSAGALVIAVVQHRLATTECILDALERKGSVRHAASIRRMLDAAGAGAESHAEADVAALVRRAGLGVPRRQVVIETPGGPRRVDLLVALPDGRALVLEIDGPHHLDPRVRREDLARDAGLIALGYVVLRIPVSVLRADSGRVLGQLRLLAAA